MTRAAFLARLRQGLRGLPQQVQDEAVADYDAHFEHGLADGRTEEEVADALGDPARLARELRAEIHLKNWEETPTPSGAAAAVFAVLGLGAVDILILLPILLAVVSVLFVLFSGGILLFFVGGGVLAIYPFFSPHPIASIFFGIGLIAGASAQLAILTLISIGLVNLLVWYGRLHFKMLKPAIEPQSDGGVQ